jgi:5-methylcytosine-specific restriction endonuclease McrA
MADRVTAKMRRAVAERARGYCEYCRCPDCFSPQPFSIDHTLPKSRGGRTEFKNLALICQGCNNHKYDKIEGLDPKSQARVNLYNPRQAAWDEHFTWSADFRQVVGITATGRATIEALQLNRDRVLNLRRVLLVTGDHPPKD